jgi:hypothetical protein
MDSQPDFSLMDVLKKLFTGADNKTWDLGRVLWAKLSIVYCAITSYQAYKTGIVSAQDWAIGAAAILAGGGGALGLKHKTEPGDDVSSGNTPSS